MSAPGKTVFYFALYLVILGLTLLISPNTLLGLFGIPVTTEVWIRVVGMLVLFLAFYYYMAAKADLISFFRWTVGARSLVIVFFTVFVLLKLAPPALILFAVIDLFGAFWTWWTLKKR
ncbi:MAG: hypothetical protein IPH16_06530 [Haliscomenobacter sp.]|nr:hypothetical protein [Haliscomenobacter sp.]MBK8880650.1 hypothetical protein [Haliscomenobacter sp.]